ncbi:hypothetical protein [Polaribacter butkevichii]|uniref:Uncharacterized protein n=1 Tax=Polaribacter butkevichii TaxID=218490 RepID=A0A2P6C6I9_9FLAO|nr:hypothetical protein [Polaribacter butkevichii]PQJ68522.1 hypothetical protein BTO14_10645 [Polaribacter butkevichii]
MKSKGVLKIVSVKRAWYERLLAAVFYAATVNVIFLFYLNNSVSFTEKYYIKSLRLLSSLIFVFSFGVRFSYLVNHHFNFDLMKYRIYWSVGPFGFGKWQDFKKLDRVSTFLNKRKECEVNIWDVKNKRYRIAVFDEIDNAVIYGRDLAKNLEIKFLERN